MCYFDLYYAQLDTTPLAWSALPGLHIKDLKNPPVAHRYTIGMADIDNQLLVTRVYEVEALCPLRVVKGKILVFE